MGESSWQVATHLSPLPFFEQHLALGQIVVYSHTPSFHLVDRWWWWAKICRYRQSREVEGELITHFLNFDYLIGALKVELGCLSLRYPAIGVSRKEVVSACWGRRMGP